MTETVNIDPFTRRKVIHCPVFDSRKPAMTINRHGRAEVEVRRSVDRFPTIGGNYFQRPGRMEIITTIRRHLAAGTIETLIVESSRPPEYGFNLARFCFLLNSDPSAYLIEFNRDYQYPW